MKKLILTILASSLLFSCSTNSSNDNSSNPTSTGLLLKTISRTSVNNTLLTNITYNGNKLINLSSNNANYSSVSNFVYNGDLINNVNGNGNDNGTSFNETSSMNYSNNNLISEIYNSNIGSTTSNYNYTYNVDGSITENNTGTWISSGVTSYANVKTIRYYSQGNCVKQERFNLVNNVMTLSSIIIYSYDNKNNPYKNITGYYSWRLPHGFGINNLVSETEKTPNGITMQVREYAYQYNSQDFPISKSKTRIDYNFSTDGTSSTPGTSTLESTETYTYY